MFVGDKDPSIQHVNHVHQCYYKSEPFHNHFLSARISFSDWSLVEITATSV